MFNDPSVNVSHIGERAESGDIVRDANVCFISGKAIVSGDVIMTLDSSHFIRVKADIARLLSRAEKDAIKAEALSQAKGMVAAEAAPVAPSDDYDSMSHEDLRMLAGARGLDLDGTRTKSQVVARFRAADVRARFADVPAEGNV